jgi:glutathione synthase/RimK-type ligase-like ATP-grasp enzyme
LRPEEKNTVVILTEPLDAHCDAVLDHLERAGVEAVRFHTEDLLQDVDISCAVTPSGPFTGRLLIRSSKRLIRTESIRSIWCRRPTLPRCPPEVQPGARRFAEREAAHILRGLYACAGGVHWVSHPLSILRASAKLYQLELARSMGLRIPRTLVTNSPQDAMGFFDALPGDAAVKSLSGEPVSSGEDSFLSYTHRVTRETVAELADSFRFGPVMLQEWVTRDRDLRVTIVGDRVFSCAVDSRGAEGARDDWRLVAPERLPHEAETLPPSLEETLREYVKRLDLEYGAVDLVRKPSGDYVFLEINPNGQWLWIEERLGFPISETLASLLVRGRA